MAYKHLTTEEMLQLSATWTDPKSKAHKAILAAPDLAPAMPRLTAAHGTLVGLAQPVIEDKRLAEIRAEALGVDGRHDNIIRGSHALLTGIAYLLGDADGGADFAQLRDTLIPEGLQSTQKSYRAEAGQAAQLALRLTPAVRAQLASILVGPKNARHTLEHYVDEWIGHGAQLGALEDERATLDPVSGEPGTGAGAALLAARNAWIRLANALVANGEVAALEDEQDALIFAPLRAAEKNAARRAARGGSGKREDGTTPETPPTK